MMGAGKSTVGRRLAVRTGMPFIDLDEEVERRAGLTIPAIFATAGEEGFRRHETAALAAAAAGPAAIVATGGGAVLDDGNVARMRASGWIVLLDASLGTLLDRVDPAERPLLGGDDRRTALAALLAAREARYRAVADVRIDTDDRSVDEVAGDIEARWPLG